MSDQISSDGSLSDPLSSPHNIRDEGDHKLASFTNRNIDDGYEEFTKIIKFISNYYPLFHNRTDASTKKRISYANEILLKKHYESKKAVNYKYYRKGSIVSNSDSLTGSQSERFKTYFLVDKFLSRPDDLTDSFAFPNSDMTSIEQNSYINDGNEKSYDTDDLGSEEIYNSTAVSIYYKYYQRLLTVEPRDIDVMKSHHLWIPSIKKEFRNILSSHERNVMDNYMSKSSPLFVEGTGYIPKQYDTYSGSTMIPAIFSEYKLPPLTYHCSVECNDNIYALGGLMACYRYDEEAPNLSDFKVKGLNNLPPPLVHNVVNNPAMVDNPHLYVINTSSNRLSRPHISGHIPPPLVAMQGSKLSDRYILFYGGFEIKTKTNIDLNGKFCLERTAFMNSNAYILDTLSFKFFKLEVVTQPYNFASYTKLCARFGHCQVTLDSDALPDSALKINETAAGETDDMGYSKKASEGNSMHESVSIQKSTPPPNKETPKIENNRTRQISTFTVLIFGGYAQKDDDSFEALNDMWKIHISVIFRGKLGYCRFEETATAKIIQKPEDETEWPSKRGFSASCIPEVSLLNRINSQYDVLKKLEEEFELEYNSVIYKMNANKKSPLYSIYEENKNDPNFENRSLKLEISNSKDNCKNKYPGNIFNNALSDLTSSSQKTNSLNNPTFVLHGGSNHLDVKGDMWWFDLETLKWKLIQTFAETENKSDGTVPISIPLVSHSLCTVGTMIVCIGGFLQSDVNTIYSTDNSYEEIKPSKGIPLGSTLLNICDLNTQCLQGYTVKNVADEGEEPEYVLNDAPGLSNQMIATVASTTIQLNGTITIVGGLLAPRQNVLDLYLRGTVLQCVLPSVSLAS